MRSCKLFETAEHYIPGGVNSPVRAFRAVGGTPLFIQSAQGATVTDVDGKTYIDYVGSWGPMILGHAHPAVLEAVVQACERGLSFGAPCEAEIALAKRICERVPSIEKVRMVNSGTEATMSAIRLARGVTGRDKIIKFEGCYHGHADSLLVKTGSGALTFGVPSSPGVPAAATADTLVATYNDLDSVVTLFERWPSDIAAIILEPIAGNMNMVLPVPGFIEGLRELCDQYQSLLIFDEVMTGFRVGPAGFQSHTTVKPDLTTLGKIIGGGMPVGAFGGRRELMDELSPQGAIYQAGTLSGNPIAMAAGIATLDKLTPDCYETLTHTTKMLVDGLQARADAAKVPFCVNYHCAMFGFFFTKEKSVTHYRQVMECNLNHFKHFFQQMLQRGIYLAPSAFEAGFISMAHDEQVIVQTLDAAEQAFVYMDSRLWSFL